MSINKKALECLVAIRDGDRDKYRGICSNFKSHWERRDGLRTNRPDLHNIFQAWGLNPIYPVNAPPQDLFEISVDVSYLDFRHGRNEYSYEYTDDLWAGEYGENRVVLLDRLITHFEGLCADIPPVS
jgi:hypothetical protein